MGFKKVPDKKGRAERFTLDIYQINKVESKTKRKDFYKLWNRRYFFMKHRFAITLWEINTRTGTYVDENYHSNKFVQCCEIKVDSIKNLKIVHCSKPEKILETIMNNFNIFNEYLLNLNKNNKFDYISYDEFKIKYCPNEQHNQ